MTQPAATMFGNYEAAKNRKVPPWAAPMLIGVVVLHAVLLVTMWIKSIWEIESLDHQKGGVDIAIAPPPPPPPPPPKGGERPHDVQLQPKKIKVKDIVQPVKIEKQEVQAPEDKGDPNGEEGGVEGGVAGGVVGGVIGEPPPPPPPPPPPAAPQIVPPTALEASRIAGDKSIHPDEVTKTEIIRSGKDKIVGSFKLCLKVDGAINSVSQVKSTGFPAYDNKIMSTIRNEWRYRPFNVNGKAVPVCTAVTFIYTLK
ncbi:MAG: putative TonB protein [Myxococcales bacterium]|nr:putative TonB protein [Myxococcales bacterium]